MEHESEMDVHELEEEETAEEDPEVSVRANPATVAPQAATPAPPDVSLGGQSILQALANLPMGGATGLVDSGAGSSRDTSVDVMLRLLQENLALGTLARQQGTGSASGSALAAPPVSPSDASASPPMTTSKAKAKQMPKHRSIRSEASFGERACKGKGSCKG